MNLLNLSKRLNKIPLNNRFLTTTNKSNLSFIQSINKLNENNIEINNNLNKYAINNNNILNLLNNQQLNYSTTTSSVSSKFKNIKNHIKRKEKNKKERKDFNKFGFSQEILESIKDKGWEKPTSIQSEVIPLVFKGRNVLFSSVTGSGKTAAYSLPFIQILSTFKRNKLEYLKNNKNQIDKENYQLFNHSDSEFKINNQNEVEQDKEEYEEEDGQEFEEEGEFEEEEEFYENNLEEIEELENLKELEEIENLNKKQINKEIEYFEDEFDENNFEIEEFDENGNLIEKQQNQNQIQEEKNLLIKKRNEKKIFNEIDPIGLILLPSKELVLQVSKEINELVKHVQFDKETSQFGKLRVATLIGGVGEKKQQDQLKEGIDIVVCTPGKLVQLINQDLISLQQVRITVIDEFDKLFNLGFFPDIRDIFQFLPKVRTRTRPFTMQTVLTSATLNHKLDELITRFAPNHLMVDLNKDLEAPKTVKQYFYHVNYRLKSNLLLYFLRRNSKSKTSLKNKKVLVFARTQQRVEKLKETLKENKINALSIHADFSITQRNKILEMFRDEQSGYDCLISTDVMARGVDIDNLEAVVNLDVPHVAEDYIHRIGRVGRNGKDGFSLTFCSPIKQIFKIGERIVGLDESHLINNIEKSTGIISKFTKIPGPWIENKKQLLKQQREQSSSNNNNNNNIKINKKNNKYENYEDDQDNNNNKIIKSPQKLSLLDKEIKYQNKQEKRAVTDLLLKKNIIESYKGPSTRDGLPRVKFNPNAKIKDDKISKIVIDRKGEIFDLPNLTDFKEGQYHEVVNSFDRKRAIKRGIKLPPNKSHTFIPSKVETKRSIKNLEKNPKRYEQQQKHQKHSKKDSSLYNIKNDD